MNLSIVIPAHNEEKRIAKTLESYINLLKGKKQDFEIIVVANGCKDKTVEIVEEVGKKFKEIRLLNFEKSGKGFAIKEGFKEALKGNSELIGFVDADMATPPESFYNLVENIKNYNGIIASRYIRGAVMRPRPTFIRILASRVFNFLIRSLFLFNFRDTQTGAKLFKRKTVEEFLPRLSMSQWAFDIDLLYNARKQGFRIKEHPTFWRDIGASKINLRKASIQMFLAAFQLRMLNSKIKRSWSFFRPIAGSLYRLVR